MNVGQGTTQARLGRLTSLRFCTQHLAHGKGAGRATEPPQSQVRIETSPSIGLRAAIDAEQLGETAGMQVVHPADTVGTATGRQLSRQQAEGGPQPVPRRSLCASSGGAVAGSLASALGRHSQRLQARAVAGLNGRVVGRILEAPDRHLHPKRSVVFSAPAPGCTRSHEFDFAGIPAAPSLGAPLRTLPCTLWGRPLPSSCPVRWYLG